MTVTETAITKLIRIPIAIPSLNDWQTMHWAQRDRIKKDFYDHFFGHVNVAPRMPKNCPWAFCAGRMVFRRPNANRDIQNYEAVFWKIIPDAMVAVGLIPNDTEKYLRRGGVKFATDRRLDHKGDTLVVVKVPNG